MAKKKFTDDMEDLFGDTTSQDVTVLDKNPSTKKRKSSKNFTSDLDSLFQDVLQESVDEHREKLKSKLSSSKYKNPKRNKPRLKHTLSGLDALIRQTVDNSDFDIDTAISGKKKRVTFTFEKQKLEQLKEIAKTKKSYLKDVIDDIISDYIKQYNNH